MISILLGNAVTFDYLVTLQVSSMHMTSQIHIQPNRTSTSHLNPIHLYHPQIPPSYTISIHIYHTNPINTQQSTNFDSPTPPPESPPSHTTLAPHAHNMPHKSAPSVPQSHGTQPPRTTPAQMSPSRSLPAHPPPPPPRG